MRDEYVQLPSRISRKLSGNTQSYHEICEPQKEYIAVEQLDQLEGYFRKQDN